MIEILAVLGLPIIGALLLAAVGRSRTCACGQRCRLRADVAGRGGADRARHPGRSDARPQPAILRRSVQCVSGRVDGLRRLHDIDLLAALHARRAGARASQCSPPAPLSQHVPALQLHNAGRSAHQQHGHPVGRDGGRDADHGPVGFAIPHAGEPGSGVEVFHPLRRRHRPGAVRHDPALFRRGKTARRRGRRVAVDRAQRRQESTRANGAVAGVRLPPCRLRHQGRTRSAAQLAARRARRRPDPGFRGALGASAQRRAVCRRALQGTGRGIAANLVRPGTADGVRFAVGRRRGVPAFPPEGHQAAVRILVHRTHGHHYLCLRDGWPDRELRGSAAHDRAFADQIGDLLRCRVTRRKKRARS